MDKLAQKIKAADWAMEKTCFDSLVKMGAAAKIDPRQGSLSNIRGRVAVIPFRGTMINRFQNAPPQYIDHTAMRAEIKRLGIDKTVGAIVLDVDSGGGTVEGVSCLAEMIYETKQIKPVIASVNGYAASAMLWTISAATKVVATRSSMIGSVGVISTHVDDTEAIEGEGYKVTYITSTDSPYKAEGQGEMSDDTREFTQARVDGIHVEFVDTLAFNYGISAEKVNSEFGRGRMFYGPEALDRGMIHQIGSIDDVIEELTQREKNQNRARAARYRRDNP